MPKTGFEYFAKASETEFPHYVTLKLMKFFQDEQLFKRDHPTALKLKLTAHLGCRTKPYRRFLLCAIFSFCAIYCPTEPPTNFNPFNRRGL